MSAEIYGYLSFNDGQRRPCLLHLALECAYVMKWTPTHIHINRSAQFDESTFGVKCA